VKHREYHDSRGFNAEENGVWEAVCPNAPNIPVHDGKTLWVLGNQAKGTFYLRDKLCAKADATRTTTRRRRTRGAPHAAGRLHESSLEAFSDRCFRFLPRDDVVWIRFVICDATVELGTLSIR